MNAQWVWCGRKPESRTIKIGTQCYQLYVRMLFLNKADKKVER